jgi:hypothetical protein
MGHLNRLLARGHARTIENLLEQAPDCREASPRRFGGARMLERARSPGQFFVDRHGTAALVQVAKLRFRTTQQVTGGSP